jgi:predicted SprT family Zn-dependent metalloprotease
MGNKYRGLNEKSPKEAAGIVGEVEKSNYLAHTIREIELAILKLQGFHYHIITYATATQNRTAKIHFSDQCSIIRLPSECEEMDDKIIRLILAHELGHLVYNFDNLKNPEILENSEPSDQEEGFAWVFAYHLINTKSVQHNSDIRRKQFIYDIGELKRTLSNIVKKKRPEIHDDVMRDLARD